MIRLKAFSIALAIAAVLSIGARQAFATTDANLSCPPQAEGGVCSDNENCQRSCDAIFGVDQRVGSCSLSCCYCFAF